MSEDTYGLDKAARLAAQEADDDVPPIRLESEFPFEVAAFDPEFWGLEALADGLLNR